MHSGTPKRHNEHHLLHGSSLLIPRHLSASLVIITFLICGTAIFLELSKSGRKEYSGEDILTLLKHLKDVDSKQAEGDISRRTQNPKELEGEEIDKRCSDWRSTVNYSSEDPWISAKWVPKPSKCKVSGMVIEELDPFHNFRRGFSLGFTDDVENKLQVLPFLRAAQDLAMSKNERRVYLDLGGNLFETSVAWFMRWYPVDFTEIHVFEARENFFVVPEPLPPDQEGLSLRPLDVASRRRAKGSGPAPLPSWMLKRVKARRGYVGVRDDAKRDPPLINVNRFIMEELRLREGDTLVVKMDIEDAEWEILEQWLAEEGPYSRMCSVVDELFVEVHYRDPTMKAYGWGKFLHVRRDAVELFNRLRAKGCYAHAWP